MSEERRQRAKEIVRSALGRKPEERTRFLREACQSDPTLLRDVEALIESYEKLKSRIESEDDAVLGSKIGKYEVLERVGQGAMGVVYKARDPLMRRLVGIKTMSSEIANDPELHDRFYREARSAGNLSHKNIITIYDLGEEGRRPFIAMEFLAGEDLKSKLDRRSKLSLEDRLRWMRETMEGLDHAHGKDVIHRDIKPANVFITREGEVKILDFGLARLTSSVATKSGLVMGTPSYMSPEQVRGEKADRQSDLFSAGATFYELFSFQKPFPGDTIHGVFYRILETSPVPLGEASPLLPAELIAIVEKLMAKDRAVRYPSAADVLRDLSRLDASLGEKKRALRVSILEAFGRVESLLGQYKEAASRDQAKADLAEDRTVSLPIPALLPGEDLAETPTLSELLPVDYLGLAATLSRARDEARHLESEIRKFQSASRLVEEAEALEERGDLGSALAKADEALRLVPTHALAASCVDRVSPRVSERDAKWKGARVEQLLREGESRLGAGALAAAVERAERIFALEPGSPRGQSLKRKVTAERERERERREAGENATRLVSAARLKLETDDDPEGCLALVSQALELDAENSDARALEEKARDRLAHLQAMATEETAAEAVAAATLAMRRGELDVASREIARALTQSPDATEIPALTLLLERARGAVEETSVETQRAEKTSEPPRAKPAPSRLAAPRSGPAVRARPSPPSAATPSSSSRLYLAASVVVALVAGILGFRALRSNELGGGSTSPTPATVPLTTSTAPSSTSSVELTTSVVTTTSVPAEPTSSVPPATSSTSTIPSTSTTTSVPPSTTTTALLTTSTVVSTTSVAAAPPVRPEDQISELMRAYERAYETLDVAGLGAIYPSVPLAVKNSFQNFKSLDLAMTTLSGPEISRSTAGPTATAVYRIAQTVEPKVGKTTISRYRATFLFAGVGTAWIIVRVDFEPEK